MQLPSSPTFIKFFDILSKDEKSQFLNQASSFLQNIDNSFVKVLKVRGKRTHPSLGVVKSHVFLIERASCSESWEIAFYDTAIPHAQLELRSRNPAFKREYSLGYRYTNEVLSSSLADVAEGFDDKPKPLLQKLLRIAPESHFAVRGRTCWVYLILKLRASPKLQQQFSQNLAPKLPILKTVHHLIEELRVFDEEVIQVSMDKKNMRQFLQDCDAHIANQIGRQKMAELLEDLNVEYKQWIDATDLP